MLRRAAAPLIRLLSIERSTLPPWHRYDIGHPAAPVALAYRRVPRPVQPEVARHVEHIERRVHESVTQEIDRRLAPPPGITQAMLPPQLLGSLTDRVIGALERRFAIERYRRGR
jgi:hypothetical protein